MIAKHTPVMICRLLHRYARLAVKNGAKSAYMAADAAVHRYFEEFGYGAGIDRVIALSQGVIWAIHWSFFKPHRTIDALWQSERRVGFVATARGTISWIEPPRSSLPR